MSYNTFFFCILLFFLSLETSWRQNQTYSADCLAYCSAALAFTFLLRACIEYDSKNTLVKSAFINIFTYEMSEASTQRLKYWKIRYKRKYILTHGRCPHTFNNTCQLIFQLASWINYKYNWYNLENPPIMKNVWSVNISADRGRWVACWYQPCSHRSAEAV